ncbi:MAG TPA: hypothetical protein VHY82_07385 [Acetobacteraceae bacterium]|nr:hypothetical protein [Acetobacteraceae bacterium]
MQLLWGLGRERELVGVHLSSLRFGSTTLQLLGLLIEFLRTLGELLLEGGCLVLKRLNLTLQQFWRGLLLGGLAPRL